ncbi:phage holin family protein [Janthinobacterium fluminis]|uniref:Phage holin family protein n=1 Tax=Janthinobacterium fluminis TaxID=2987524 RepID=A0ABT5K4X5_9BURK|nr:phage holin family protein [Janthinobacterium fluminis]MDC8760059.1 phage holin family protein [Janthinobacterium fluminis]
MEKSAASQAPGLIASLAGVAKNTIGLLLSRLELASCELAEARNHALRLLAVFALALVAGLFTVTYASVTVVYLAWDALGWKILPIMTAGFLVLAAGLLLYARALLRQGKLSLPATMAELKADRDMLL